VKFFSFRVYRLNEVKICSTASGKKPRKSGISRAEKLKLSKVCRFITLNWLADLAVNS